MSTWKRTIAGSAATAFAPNTPAIGARMYDHA